MNNVTRAPYQVLVIPYRRVERKIEFAALKRADLNVWQFVAGGGHANESPENAALREVEEEIGIAGRVLMKLQATSSIPVKYFKARDSWSSDLFVIPEYSFAINCDNFHIVLSDEHVEIQWGEYSAINNMLEWDSNKTALWELAERLQY